MSTHQGLSPSLTHALLGPTNTGKTYRAIERMLEHPTGMMGLPLRLLAREVYDKVSARCGETQVALVTGEEKRIPVNPRYWISTVEAMPLSVEVDFLAVDEIQLAAHPERGHVFTDRLLHARGRVETWFLGAETMRTTLEELVPTASFAKSPRLSQLSEAGRHTLATLPRRSAVVAFSLPRVFELAALLRKRRGGTAVVIGALSPRARNAQVALYQAGEVDFLVATDAIGMGLNLDIEHIAFADLRKFDGREARPLELAELGQIAGRAGRYTRNGTFGTLAPLEPLARGVGAALEGHRFDPVRRLFWRSAELDFDSIDALLVSLAKRPSHSRLRRPEIAALDQATLMALAERADVRRRANSADAVALLWSVCSIPDYRQLLLEDHVALTARIFGELLECSHIDPAWVENELQRASELAGDPDTLMGRIAQLRTINYVAHQPGWLERGEDVQLRARKLEDELSDALHRALVATFVDRSKSTSRAGRAASVPASPASQPRAAVSPFAALAHLLETNGGASAGKAVTESLVERAIEAGFAGFQVQTDASISYDGQRVGRLVRGRDLLSPEVIVTLETDGGSKLRLARRLLAWSRDLVSELIGAVRDVPGLSAAGRGLVHVVMRGLGTVLASRSRAQLAELSVADQERLRAAGLRLGGAVVYLAEGLKSLGLARRIALVTAFVGSAQRWPRGTEVSIAPLLDLSPELHAAIGYPIVGPRAVRADILERFAARLLAAPDGEAVSDATLASWLGCKQREAALVRQALSEE